MRVEVKALSRINIPTAALAKILVWLGVQDNQYKRNMAALVTKWVDAGKPDPGEDAKPLTKLERVVEAGD